MPGIENTVVYTIPHGDQRYDTCGDWVYDDKDRMLAVYTSKTEDWRESFCVAIHEQVEAALCIRAGIRQADVDAFDIAYEAKRVEGDESEPGDSLDAPYYHEHQIATQVERIVATAIGLHWPTYEANLYALPQGAPDVKQSR